MFSQRRCTNQNVFEFIMRHVQKMYLYITNRLNEFIIFTISLFQTVFIDFFCVSIRNHFVYFCSIKFEATQKSLMCSNAIL